MVARGRRPRLAASRFAARVRFLDLAQEGLDRIALSATGHSRDEEACREQITSEFGSPLYVISEKQLRTNVRRFREAFARHWPGGPVAVLPGVPACADRILPEVRVPEVQPGDVVAILDTGAYQEGSASNFNALPRPATVLVSGSDAEIIKRAETIDDVFARDRLPQRLLATHTEQTEVP